MDARWLFEKRGDRVKYATVVIIDTYAGQGCQMAMAICFKSTEITEGAGNVIATVGTMYPTT